MDTLTPEIRSWNMSRIRGENTKPELAVRSILHKMGYRFRLKNKILPGKPDIILPRFKTVIFVHGCFWHRHKGCRYTYNPKSKIEFWQRKFAANIKRDKLVTKQIRNLKWNHFVLWECEIKNKENLKIKIKALLGDV